MVDLAPSTINKIRNSEMYVSGTNPYLPSGTLLGSVILHASGSTDGTGELGLYTDCAVDSLRV